MSGPGAHEVPAATSHPVSPLVALGRVLFHTRDAVLPVVLFGLAALGAGRRPLGGPQIDAVCTAAGVLLALAGQALRAMVIGLVYIQRGGKNRRIHADALVETGFFAHSRNPLYVGNILIQAGLLLVLHSVWGYALGLPFVLLVYVAIVAAEEHYLRQQFGAAYEDYCRRVPRFLPRLAGLRSTLASTTFDWRRLVRKEYGATAAWMSLCCALLLWKTHLQTGLAARPAASLAVAGAWVLVLAGYAVARRLKKSGRLG